MHVESITLYYRDGSSDKVYQANIDEVGGLYEVNFAYGRRGSTLNTGQKTKAPVALEEARKIYEKIVKEKRSKGYEPGEAAADYVPAAVDKTDVDPCQLLNDMTEAELASHIRDDRYWMQEKKDGVRLRLISKSEGVQGRNKKGLVRAVPAPLSEALLSLGIPLELDGECIGECYYAFDLLSLAGEDLRTLPYRERYERLVEVAPKIEATGIEVLRAAKTQAEKEALAQRIEAEGREGVVFKDKNAPYTPGRPASGGSQRKFKFYKTASVIVGPSKRTDKRSVAMYLLDGSRRVAVGNVLIPSNHDVPPEESIIEVRYLHAFPESNALYGPPVFLGLRDDVDTEECVLSQLHYKVPDAALSSAK